MKNIEKFKATITALATPFYNGVVDFESLSLLVQQQIDGGIEGFVINGTTAESPTLQWIEVEKIFHFVRKKVGSHFPLIVGTGTNCTKQSIENSKKAEEMGADALLVVVPYYNKPPQRGLIQHFTQIADSVKIPIFMYNVPARTITTLNLNSIIKLSEHPNIAGIKEASGNIDLAKQILENTNKDFILLSGDDGSYPEFLSVGGHGVISVASHILPEIFCKLKKDYSEPARISFHKNYDKLISLLFSEANPIPLKRSLTLMGIIKSAEMRLPLSELEENLTRDLVLELEAKGLL